MVWAWPFSIDFSDNNFGCGTKKCMQAGDRKQLYYKSWPNVVIIIWFCSQGKTECESKIVFHLGEIQIFIESIYLVCAQIM